MGPHFTDPTMFQRIEYYMLGDCRWAPRKGESQNFQNSLSITQNCLHGEFFSYKKIFPFDLFDMRREENNNIQFTLTQTSAVFLGKTNVVCSTVEPNNLLSFH